MQKYDLRLEDGGKVSSINLSPQHLIKQCRLMAVLAPLSGVKVGLGAMTHRAPLRGFSDA